MSDRRRIYALCGHGDIELYHRPHDALKRAVEIVDQGDELLVRTWTQYGDNPWHEDEL